MPMGNVSPHPGGLTHASRPTLPIEMHIDVPLAYATSALPAHSASSLPSQLDKEPSSELVASKRSKYIITMPISIL